MENQPKEDPFRQPEVGIITKERAKHITDKGGKAAYVANPNTPSFMINDQDNPKSLPKQDEPKTPNIN